MKTRIRFTDANDVFAAFPGLKHTATPPVGDAAPLDFLRAPRGLAAAGGGAVVSRSSPAAPRSGVVGLPMLERGARRKQNGRSVADCRSVGARSHGSRAARRVALFRDERRARTELLAGPRRRPFRRQRSRRGPAATPADAGRLRVGRERGDRSGCGVAGAALDPAVDARLRRSRRTVRRRRRASHLATARLAEEPQAHVSPQ